MTMLTMSNLFVSRAQSRDKEDHRLVKLWETYHKAENADKPQDAADALLEIKKEAYAQGYAWDWYDAGLKLISVKSSINWKERASLTAEFEVEVNGCDIPVVRFYHRSEPNLLKLVKDNAEKLQASHNPEFYKRDWHVSSLTFGSILPEMIENDYEYCLWGLCTSYAEACDLLGERLAGRYPLDAFAEFSQIRSTDTEPVYIAKLEAYAKKWQGKAVSLMAREILLQKRFDKLESDNKSSEASYLALKADCESLIAEGKAYQGGEKEVARCCKSTDHLLESLNSKAITIEADRTKVSIGLRNLKSVKLKLMQGKKTVYETTLTNKAGSFYVFDKLETVLPAVNDGEYVIKASSGNTETSIGYEKYTLSIAARRDAASYATYVADHMTGEPVKNYRLALFDDEDTSVGPAESVSGEGFVKLPEGLASRISQKRYGVYLQASCTDATGKTRLSKRRYLDTYDYPVRQGNDPSVIRATVFTDRTAFNPGETVHFKTILYRGTFNYEVLSGRKLKASLKDPQGKVVGSVDLLTNEFGSASGEFLLTGSDRGGPYRISISENGASRAETSIRVDEFVLPSYTLSWDRDERKHLPGERVNVSGVLKSYSGHALGSAKLSYNVISSGMVLASGTPDIKPDGSFSISFVASNRNWDSYQVTMKIVDGTGETLEFSTSVRSGKDVGLGLVLQDAADGHYTVNEVIRSRAGGSILKGDVARVKVYSADDSKHPGMRISYDLVCEGKSMKTGLAGIGEILEFDLAGKPSGIYTLKAKSIVTSEAGKEYREEQELSFVRTSSSDTKLNFDAESFFKRLEGDDIAVQVGTTSGKTWVAVELFGVGNELLGSQMVQLSGEKGKAGSLKTVRMPWKDAYGGGVRLNMLFFKNGRSFTYSTVFQNEKDRYVLPLSFSRFEDRTSPAKDYVFSIRTAADVECAAAIFDASTETVSSNRWRTIAPRQRPVPDVSYSIICGNQGSLGIYYGREREVMMSKAGGRVMMRADVVDLNAAPVEEMAIPVLADQVDIEESPAEEIAVRSDFQNTLAWEPHLLSDANGDMTLRFRTSDKLSTYFVQLFAHDKAFNNSTIRREMLVTIPVKASIVEPLFLYEGDRYVAKAAVTSGVKEDISGRLSISFLNGGDYRNAATIGGTTESVTIPAGGSLSFEAEVVVPKLSTLGILVRFEADNAEYGSDAVFVDVPVYPAEQTITEAHSALLRAGDDRAALESSLRSMFANVDGSKAMIYEISILDMIREALPEKAVPSSDNVLEQSDALWANQLIARLSGSSADEAEMAQMEKKITACRNSDGGYGWFAGMRSNAIVTAVLLERFAAMGDDCPVSIKAQIPDAVGFLDRSYFSSEARPYWMGWLSMAQYLHVRAMYADVDFSFGDVDSRRRSEFRKAAKEYLVPKKARGMNGQIFDKARRLQTLQQLAASGDGVSLAKAWGIRLGTGMKLQKSMAADVESLLQYAVDHKSGGVYYPNAVMPWRGLLEGELYAHNLLSRLMTDFGHDDISEGIRLWTMVQKETQQWSDDHAFIEAISNVLEGKPETLQAKVLVLSASATLPFAQVKAAGNGFTVSRSYGVSRVVGDRQVVQPLNEGDTLRVGDKVIARYSIWNEENRSFVRLNAPRPASFRPVQQLSGWYRGGYRNVLADKSEYWFDSYPEENSVIEEEFFVTQAGSFQSPVISIESLYAPHYRANDAAASETTKVLPPM